MDESSIIPSAALETSIAIVSSLFDNCKIVQVNVTLLVVSGNLFIYIFIIHLVHEIKMVAYFSFIHK